MFSHEGSLGGAGIDQTKKNKQYEARRKALVQRYGEQARFEGMRRVVNNREGVINPGGDSRPIPLWYSVIEQDGVFVGASLQDDLEEPGEACASIAVDESEERVSSFVAGTSKKSKGGLDGSKDPEVKRDMKYMVISIALVFQLMERHPEFRIIKAYPESVKRNSAYAFLERYGFKKRACSGIEEFVLDVKNT